MFRHLSITAIGYTGQLLLTLVTSILAARLLGPTARGELAAIMMLPLVLQIATSFGMPQALTYFTARHARQAGAFLGAAMAASALVCIPVTLIALAVQPGLLSAYPQSAIATAQIYLAAMLPLLTLTGIPSSTFLGRKDYLHYHLLRLLPSALYLVAVISALWAPEPERIALVYLASTALVGMPMVIWFYIRHVAQPVVFSRTQLRDILPYAAVTLLSTLPQTIAQRLDQFVVLVRLDATSLGLYSIASGMGLMLYTLQTAAGTILLPYLAESEHDTTHRHATFSRLFRLTVLASAVLVGGLLVVLPVLVPLMFGDDFRPAVVPAAMLVVAFGLTGINQALSDGFRGLGHPRLPLYTEAVGLATKLAFLATFYSNLTLNTAALLAMAGPLAVLAINLFLYHTRVEALDRRWLLAWRNDLTLMWHTLSQRLQAIRK